MLEAIKQVALGAIDAAGPVMVQLGVVTNVNPLKVMVDNRLELTEDFFILPECLTEQKIMIGSQEIEIRKGLAAGDKLLLIRMQGGQRYAIMHRVVGG